MNAKPMTARHMLRLATQVEHDRLDAAAGAFDLSSREGMAGFHAMMLAGFGAVEAGLDEARAERYLPEWPSRQRAELLRADAGRGADADAGSVPKFPTEASVWGALYVLEGSRLGSRMLVRGAAPSRFLEQSAEDGFWPAFVLRLEAAHQRLDAPEEMAEGARHAFAAFLID